MSQFTYTDQITGDQLRILTLEPSSDDRAIVECTLSTETRSACDPYEALSYSWGDEPPSANIFINGLTFELRENVNSALRHLRTAGEKRRLWIDAICINQTRDEEKNEQVARMGETYGQSIRALAWLGSSGNQSGLAMNAIKARALQFDGESVQDVYRSSVPLPDTIDNVDSATFIPAVNKLLQRSWFTRLWVFQEVCLAPQVIMICGHDTIDFTQFAHFSLSLTNCPSVQHGMQVGDEAQKAEWVLLLQLIDLPLIFHRQVLQTTQEELPRNGNVDAHRRNTCVFLKLLWSTRNRACKERPDRVYALRSMALDIDRNVMMPNYGEDLEVTYAKVTFAIISRSGKLDVMLFCRDPRPSGTAGRSWPTWVPDFDLRRADPNDQIMTGCLTNFIGPQGYFNAANGSIANPDQQNGYSELIVSGFDIGTVVASHNVQWLNGTIQQARQMVETGTWNIKNQTSTEIFWRTLISNRAANSSPASVEVEGVEFHRWWDIYNHPTEDMPSLVQTVSHYNRAYHVHALRRRLFTTDSGWVGLGPPWLENGDHICLLAGAQTAFTLRPQSGKYQVVGETYVHGIMHGEHWKALHDAGARQNDFILM